MKRWIVVVHADNQPTRSWQFWRETPARERFTTEVLDHDPSVYTVVQLFRRGFQVRREVFEHTLGIPIDFVVVNTAYEERTAEVVFSVQTLEENQRPYTIRLYQSNTDGQDPKAITKLIGDKLVQEIHAEALRNADKAKAQELVTQMRNMQGRIYP